MNPHPRPQFSMAPAWVPVGPSKRSSPRRAGIALIIVLAFVVLLSGLIVAFFSRSVTNRQLASSSANRVKADLLADGAVNTILSDLKQEIVDGSLPPTSTTNPVYVPSAPANVMPSLSVKKNTSHPNLLKQSAGSPQPQPVYAVGPTKGPIRASSVSSTTPSVNNRAITPERWNLPVLLDRNDPTSPSNLTPVDGAANTSNAKGFVAPDWVLVNRNGLNPTTPWSTSMRDAKVSNGEFVVGRYAYNVYHEGGLLDLNVAGYPAKDGSSANGGSTVITPVQTAYKDALPFADLKQIPGIGVAVTQGGKTQPFLSASRQEELVSGLAGWRNYTSLKPTTGSGNWYSLKFPNTAATDFLSFVRSNPTGFLTPSTNVPMYVVPGASGAQSDKFFSSRQQLIQMLAQGLTSGAERANGLNALPYFSHFSRDVNQPSLAPVANRPKVATGDGGNLAAGGDDIINPSFLTVRATPDVQRYDAAKSGGLGAKADASEPLVKKRFTLNRLAWITYKGPSANNMSDPAVQQTITSLGGNPTKPTDPIYQFVAQGNAQNIYNYFGLSWVSVSSNGSTANVWVYSHNGTTPVTAPPTAATGTAIKTLAGVLGAKREADFVELLKASINVGSLAKGATDSRGAPFGAPFELAQWTKDTSPDAAVLQIAANIIDQYDADGYPTIIRYAGGNGSPVRELRGVENLPYYYRASVGLVQSALPVPNPSANWYEGVSPGYDAFPSVPAFTNTGFYTALLEPQIWNPHDQNSSLGNPRPQKFRLVVDSTSLDVNGVPGAYNKVSFKAVAAAPNNNVDSTTGGLPLPVAYAATPRPPFYNNYAVDPVPLTAANTELDFEVPDTSLFREPTLLMKPGIPTNSKLKLGVGNSLATKFSGTPYASYFPGDGVKALNNITGEANKSYLGIYLGVAPLRWVRLPSGTGQTPRIHSAHRQNMVISVDNVDPAMTVRVQCQNADGNWVTYDEKYAQISNTPGWLIVDSKGNPDPEASVGQRASGGDFRFGNRAGASVVVDPRTSRFGMVSGWRGDSDAWTLDGNANPKTMIPWLDQAQDTVSSMRPDAGVAADNGYLDAKNPTNFSGLPKVPGWFPAVNGKPSWIMGGGHYRAGYLSQNNPNLNPTQPYFADADGVVRRAMGANWTSSTTPDTLGLPMAKTINGANKQSQSRPIVLNRPFRTVGELGHVFSDTPWRNMDVSTPESGFAGLLDAFSINGTDDPHDMVAGKVNLNTRQAPVLQAILAGAYRDEFDLTKTPTPANPATIPGYTQASGANSLAAVVAQALVDKTTSTAADKGPLTNISELVGRWVGSQPITNGGVDGSKSYSGFADLTAAIGSAGTSTTPPYAAGDKSIDQNIQRFREASIRALSASGQTRVWNLMIDVVAQSGRYPLNATALDKFLVEGEQRYWVHLAIDRFTGQVIDKQIEIVKE